MKNLFSLCLAGMVAIAAVLPASAASGVEADAGAYDFGEFIVPEDGAQFVEINLTRELISLASRLVGKDEPEIAAVLAGLQRVRVNVVGLNDTNRAELKKRVSDTRATLAQRGWQRVVTVREDKEDVAVFVKLRGDEAIDGIVVTVIDGGDEAVFINVVGDIKPEQLVTVGERFGIEPLKELRMPGTAGG